MDREAHRRGDSGDGKSKNPPMHDESRRLWGKRAQIPPPPDECVSPCLSCDNITTVLCCKLSLSTPDTTSSGCVRAGEYEAIRGFTGRGRLSGRLMVLVNNHQTLLYVRAENPRRDFDQEAAGHARSPHETVGDSAPYVLFTFSRPAQPTLPRGTLQPSTHSFPT